MFTMYWKDKMAIAMSLMMEACDQSTKEEVECGGCLDAPQCKERETGCLACPLILICDACVEAFDSNLPSMITAVINKECEDHAEIS